ncbi:MAG: hypothetical protein ACRDJY_04685, partial [Thermoleophilaceae bacterium]
LALGEDAPPPDAPAELGGTNPGAFPAGDSEGSLTEEPPEAVTRFDSLSIAWTGSPMGVDRPVDQPFVSLERMVRGQWQTSDTDLGLAFIWREESGDYSARYEVPGSQPLGQHRLHVHSAAYDLTSRPFAVRRSSALKLRGVLKRRKRLLVVAQNAVPDPERAILWRSTVPAGGKAVIRIGKRKLKATWRPRRLAYVVKPPFRVRKGRRVTVLRVKDAYGNRVAGKSRVRVGALAPLEWPENIGTGDGRTPGPLGEGNFPP